MTRRAGIICNVALTSCAVFLGMALAGQAALAQGTSCVNLPGLEQQARQLIIQANNAMRRSTGLFFEAEAAADPERAQILFELSDSEAEVSSERRGLALALREVVELCDAL